ncbi:hypothetical protein ACX27_26710 [Nostoc piscinale CENA21]|uniref:Uncharacterized protein n=1 Tax=Nostoc piscinale CENA21 TaxID=224013 RepID=A0A0M4T5P2_9NOSO|nr:hypothetical protein ACX27_26710 [Nostoc piscinale CENA21]
MTLEDLLHLLMVCTGEYLSQTYYQMLDMQLDDALYHALTWRNLKEKQNKVNSSKPYWAEGVEWQEIQ